MREKRGRTRIFLGPRTRVGTLAGLALVGEVREMMAWSLCWQEPLVQTWIPGLCVGGKIEMYVDIISNIANVGFFPRVADPLAHLLSKGQARPSGPPH